VTYKYLKEVQHTIRVSTSDFKVPIRGIKHTLRVVRVRRASTSDPPVLTEKQKVLAKLSVLVPRTNTSALSVTQLSNEEWLRYKGIIPRVFKFLNHCPEEGISAQFLGTSFCQPDTFMADTGADIMLVTQDFCDNMGLGVGPTNPGIQTSVSRLGGLIGQLTDPFDLVLASGTEFELRIPVGPRTEIGIIGVSQNSPVYQVLLCQGFHHIAGGYVHPVMGRFVKDSSAQATLEGVQVSGLPGTRVAQTSMAVERKSEVDYTRKNSTSRPLIKWVLPTCPLKGPAKLLSPQTRNEDMSKDIQINFNPQSFSTSSPRTLEAMAF
jgi:hypothetical protein